MNPALLAHHLKQIKDYCCHGGYWKLGKGCKTCCTKLGLEFCNHYLIPKEVKSYSPSGKLFPVNKAGGLQTITTCAEKNTFMQKIEILCSIKAKVLCSMRSHPNKSTDCDQHPPYATVLPQNKILQGDYRINLEDTNINFSVN